LGPFLLKPASGHRPQQDFLHQQLEIPVVRGGGVGLDGARQVGKLAGETQQRGKAARGRSAVTIEP
jgi:hypothetical protein